MAISKEYVVTPAVSATGTLKRTVSDWIRRLNPARAPVCAMVKASGVDDMGNMSYGAGLISKKSTPGMKFEWYTSTPPVIYHTATGGTSTTAVIADTTGFIVRDTIVNLRTKEVAVVNTLTSSTTLTVTAIGGTWSCSAGDVIAMACNTQEEASSTATSRTQEPSNNYNYVFPFRYPVAMAATAMKSPHYTENPWDRYKRDNMDRVLEMMENICMLGKRASSGDTTSVTIGGTAYNMFTTRGIIDYAQTVVDCSGTMDWDRLNLEVAQQLPDTLASNGKLKFIAGKKICNWMYNMASKNFQWDSSGEKDVYGVLIKSFYIGSYKLDIVPHNLFNKGTMANEALIIDTSDFALRYKEGLDVHWVENIQTRATMGRMDDVQGTIGLQCKSGGENVIHLKNFVTT